MSATNTPLVSETVPTTVETTNGKPAKSKKTTKKPAPTTKSVTPKTSTQKKLPAAKKTAVDGSLRGIPKGAKWKPAKKQLSFAEIKEKTGASGLRAPQAALLTALAKAKNPLNRSKLHDITGIDNTYVGVWLGRSDPAKRVASESAWGYTSLLTLKFVNQKTFVIDDRETLVYEITASGRKELEKYNQMVKDNAAAEKDAEKQKAARAKERAKKAAK